MRDLQLSPGNSLGQIAVALGVLSQTAQDRETALARYGTLMGVCELNLQGHQQLTSVIRTVLALLRTDLLKIIPPTRDAVQILEAHTHLLIGELDLSQPSVREDASLFLQTLDPSLQCVFAASETIQIFRAHIESIRTIQGLEILEDTSLLLDCLDDALALSNRLWFCYRDMEESLRVALA